MSQQQLPRNGTRPPQVSSPSRMTLSALVRGKQERPLRVVLYGVEGVGKSTFAANAPAPIFLGAEDGTSHLDVARFPMPRTWTEIMEAAGTLTRDAHEFGTLVVDTLDWAEPLLWAYICERDGKDNVEDYGYGKGYTAALEEWRVFLAALERLRDTRKMHVIFLAHSWIKPFKNPEGDDFDRYEMKLHARAAGLVKEWCDAVLFANWETFATKDKATKRVKGISTGARLVYTVRTAAYDAKNRHDLPESMPLSWSDFAEAVAAHRPADPVALLAEIQRKAKELGGEIEIKTTAAIERAAGSAAKLAQLNDWLNAKTAERS